jgi:protein involved in polysaccharide export with SLBB domain
MSRWSALVALIVCLAGVAAASASEPRYRIRAGDTLELSFLLTPEFNQTVLVRPDGRIPVRGGGDLDVSGLTTEELSASLRAAYAHVLRNPVITVDVKDSERASFLVLGEVAKPGKYELRTGTSVTGALAMAGGLTSAARHSQVVVFRAAGSESVEATKVNIKLMLQQADLGSDPPVRAGDMLFVPRDPLANFGQFISRVALALLLRPPY